MQKEANIGTRYIAKLKKGSLSSLLNSEGLLKQIIESGDNNTLSRINKAINTEGIEALPKWQKYNISDYLGFTKSPDKYPTIVFDEGKGTFGTLTDGRTVIKRSAPEKFNMNNADILSVLGHEGAHHKFISSVDTNKRLAAKKIIQEEILNKIKRVQEPPFKVIGESEFSTRNPIYLADPEEWAAATREKYIASNLKGKGFIDALRAPAGPEGIFTNFMHSSNWREYNDVLNILKKGYGIDKIKYDLPKRTFLYTRDVLLPKLLS